VLHGQRSLPRKSWVREAENLERIMTETAGISTWLCCFGKQALWAVEALVASGKQTPWSPVVTYHLGSQGINHIKKDLEDQSIPKQEECPEIANQTFLRLEVVAAGMLGQMNMLCYVPRGNTNRWQRWLPPWAPARMQADLSRSKSPLSDGERRRKQGRDQTVIVASPSGDALSARGTRPRSRSRPARAHGAEG
jgi:hypothetical protein